MLITAEPEFGRFWYVVAFADDVQSAPLSRRLLNTDLVLWRSQAGVHAAIDRCPHRWAKLSAGRVAEDGAIVCAYHGWHFDKTGKATVIPQLPRGAAIPPRACLTTLPAMERLGFVWASLSNEPVGGLPTIPEFDDPSYRSIQVGAIEYRCSAAAVIDNNTDATHVAFIHSGTFGAGQDPRIGLGKARRTNFGLMLEAETPVANRPGDDTATVRSATTEIWAPFVQVSRMRFPDGLVHVLVKGCSPTSDNATVVHLMVLRNDIEQPAPNADIVAFERAVELEDELLLSTLPPDFPLMQNAQVHLRHDRGGVLLRRMYDDIIHCRPNP